MTVVSRKGVKYRTILSDHFPERYGLACKLPSLAKQADRDMFNPNTVMKVFRRTGDLSLFQRRQGFYADISHLSTMSSYMDVQAAMQPIVQAFYSLPAVEREKFGHDPMNFLDFAKNPANLKWLADQGFLGEIKSVVPPTEDVVSSQNENVGSQ